MASVYDVAIVGAGVLGLGTARALAARGLDFVVLERAEIGHQGAGSKGSCRIFRLGYPDPGYVAAARRAKDRWLEVEAETGRRILLPTPQLTFGPRLQAIHDAMRAAGAPCELLSRSQAAQRFEQIRIAGPALLETQSCVTVATEALAALAAAAGLKTAGRIRTGVTVTDVADDGRQVTLRTTGGEVSARVAVITAGPWTAGLLAPRLRVPTEATLEQVGYLKPAGQQHEPAPIFIYYDDQSPYGLPVPGSDLYKIGVHPSGPTADPDMQDETADSYLLARLTEVADRWLPGYQSRPIATERCIYDNTPDEDFIVDRIGNVVIGCGTSGHGFKFGPLFGDWLAALATEGPGGLADDSATPGPGERFRLARFQSGLGAAN